MSSRRTCQLELWRNFWLLKAFGKTKVCLKTEFTLAQEEIIAFHDEELTEENTLVATEEEIIAEHIGTIQWKGKGELTVFHVQLSIFYQEYELHKCSWNSWTDPVFLKLFLVG